MSIVQFLVLWSSQIHFEMLRNNTITVLFDGSLKWGPRTQDSKTWDPGTLKFAIELQNKTLKGKKSLTSKRDNAKYTFTYFSPIKIIGFLFSS